MINHSQTLSLVKDLIVYKKLFSYDILETYNEREVYYKLEDLYDYITSESYVNKTLTHVDKNIPKDVLSHYLDNLYFLREHGLPHYKQEQFNTFNLSKLYSIDILRSHTNSKIVNFLENKFVHKIYLVDNMH